MGTYCRVIGQCGDSLSYQLLESELLSLNSVLSNYEVESEISL